MQIYVVIYLLVPKKVPDMLVTPLPPNDWCCVAHLDDVKARCWCPNAGVETFTFPSFHELDRPGGSQWSSWTWGFQSTASPGRSTKVSVGFVERRQELQWEDLWRISMNFCQWWTFTWVCVLGCFVSSLFSLVKILQEIRTKCQRNQGVRVFMCFQWSRLSPKGLGDPEWLQDVRRDVREVAKERGGPAPSSIKESDHRWQWRFSGHHWQRILQVGSSKMYSFLRCV